MAKTICKICEYNFKTEKERIFHESTPINEFDDNFSILKNDKKYFFMTSKEKITRKHSRIYEFEYFYKYMIEKEIYDGFKIKKAGIKMPASEVEKRLDSGEFDYATKKEAGNISKFLNEKFGSTISSSYTSIQQYLLEM